MWNLSGFNMIIPKKLNDPKKNYFSATVTATVCFIFYIILVISSVADPDKTRIEITELSELNITNIRPQVEEPEIEQPAEESPQQEESPTEIEIEVETPAPQRINMSEILPEGVRVDLSIQETERTRTTQPQTEIQTESRSLRMDDSELERSGIRSLTGNNLSTPNAERRSLSGGATESGGIDLAEGGNRISGRRSLSDAGGGSLLDGPQVRDGNEQGREVGLRNLSDFGENYTDVEPIYNDLVKWMKENPAELPPSVRRVMGDGRWDPNYLTSRVPFYIEDRQFDLLLMVKEADVEVHIFLVESMEEATYLIDSGFQKESSSLRVGSVGYQNEDIAEIDSQMRTARTEDTQEFYQIFLSWWNTIEI